MPLIKLSTLTMNKPLSNPEAHSTGHRGFTLIELVITIVILGFSAMVMLPFLQVISETPDPMIRQRAISLGQALLDEILAKRWDENTAIGGGPIRTSESPAGKVRSSITLTASDPEASTISATPEEGAGNRANFDDIDDYNGFSETDTFSDQTGGTTISMPRYTRTATITYIPSITSVVAATTPAGTTAGGQAAATDTKRVVVTITAPNQETFNFVTLRCNL